MKKLMKTAAMGAAVALLPLSAQAELAPMSNAELSAIHGQGYTITVGAVDYAVPFAFEVFSAKADPAVLSAVAGLVSGYAPGLPSGVDSKRSAAVGIVNSKLADVVAGLQMIPYWGPLVPTVSVAID
ncbi:MAG: hypothetical protein SVU69_08405 [Pseudomonadota bacterium]|nr:hypothetical protein [Pseudomonadota bacterium]